MCPHDNLVVYEAPSGQWGFFVECADCGRRGPVAWAAFLARRLFRQKFPTP